MTLVEQILSSVPGDALANLRRVDRLWQSYREDTLPLGEPIKTSAAALGAVEWDVVISGGTLGVFVGAALAQRGWRVALLERGILQGRQQEWNISRRELHTFVELGLLSGAELETAIATEYNPARIAFHQGGEYWVRDILNIGVDPVSLLATLKAKFLAAGGHLLEQTPFDGAVVHPDGVCVQAGGGLKTRLLLDAMGHFSPISRQARQGRKPDAVCLVVGTCAQGIPAQPGGDLLVSFTPLAKQCQYFWEAFPARDGRTTYLFTYLDADEQRFSLEDLFHDYLTLLPQYQGVTLEQVQIQRALFGMFPCYQDSPLRSPWNRILAIGDSSGSQSPLSFGGFGALIRHLHRLVNGIDEALHADLLDRTALGWLQPYQPNLSVTWLFQKAMSVRVDQPLPSDQINRLLEAVFQEMARLVPSVLHPFLQDVVQFTALSRTLLQTAIAHPLLVLSIVPQVGLWPLVNWLGHYAALGGYTALYPVLRLLQPIIKTAPPYPRYYLQRVLEALQYGAGKDYCP